MQLDVKDDEYDLLTFFPGDTEDQVVIQTRMFKDKGVKVEGSPLGDMYHIVLFKQDEEGVAKDLDCFEAILCSPVHYMSNLINMNWYGMICRKTTTTDEYIEQTVDLLRKS